LAELHNKGCFISVSSTFFNGVKRYVDSWHPGRDLQYHPLNWNCKATSSLCFPHANRAREFFAQILKHLESHYGNCYEKMPKDRYTWICPSYSDPNDSLCLNVHPDNLSFASAAGSGECRVYVRAPYEDSYFNANSDLRSFTCHAWNFLDGTDHQLHFDVNINESGGNPGVSEYDNQGETTGEIGNVGFAEYLTKNAKFDPNFQFAQFMQQSEHLQKWQQGGREGNGLFQAFVAAIESKSAPAKPVPPSTASYPASAPASSGSTESNGFASGLIIGVIGTVSVVFALALLRKQKNAIP
jgi:hypothetical protein